MPIHFTADKKTLVSLIQPTMTAVSSRNTLPALEGLLFTLKGSELSGLRLRPGKRRSDGYAGQRPVRRRGHSQCAEGICHCP